MPITMKRKYSIEGSYTEKEKEILTYLVDLFRVSVSDDDPEKNILNNKANEYSDKKIIALLDRAMQDINGGYPLTHFSIIEFAERWDNTLIVDGAVAFSLIAEGLLQIRNQVDYSDSGLTIALFNKSPQYQGWAGFLMNNYLQAKSEFKRAYTIENQPSIFHGIGSEFGYYQR